MKNQIVNIAPKKLIENKFVSELYSVTENYETIKSNIELMGVLEPLIVDENNVVLADAAGIAEGKALFTQSCIACHAADGGGGIGPNLTDEFWIHGGSMNNIYKTIKIGYAEKGMQSWESMYSPVQMKNLASFVKSLKGTKPAVPKAPQGSIDQENAVTTDSTVQLPKQ